jgi:hypothetical protein
MEKRSSIWTLIFGAVAGAAVGVGCAEALREPPDAGLPAPADSGDDDHEADGVWAGAVDTEHFEGETFTHIWGTDDELWILGTPVSAPADAGPIGPGLECGPERFHGATNIVRRRRAETWERLEVPTDVELLSLHGSSASDVWAVGPDATVLQFDGESWRTHDVRSARDLALEAEEPCSEVSLHGVFALGPTDVWVVGYIFPSPSGAGLILHFDGQSWARHPIDAPDTLFAVWASSATDVWTVGASGLVYRWNGTRWERNRPDTEHYLTTVFGLSADDVWAAGNTGVAVHFDGAAWTLKTSSEANASRSALTGNAELGLHALHTVFDASSALQRQSVVRWTGSEWQEQSFTIEVDALLGDLWVTPDSQLWGVGRSVIRFR